VAPEEQDQPELPLSQTLTGDADSGGLAGQGGMTEADGEEDQPA
jgi:hypothetical protein